MGWRCDWGGERVLEVEMQVMVGCPGLIGPEPGKSCLGRGYLGKGEETWANKTIMTVRLAYL